jgi:hypothetical protein
MQKKQKIKLENPKSNHGSHAPEPFDFRLNSRTDASVSIVAFDVLPK